MKLYLLVFAVTNCINAAINAPEIYRYDAELRDFSRITKQEVGISVLAYNRPNYFEQVIHALEQNSEAQTMPFFFILEGGPDAKQAENEVIISNSSIKNKYIIKRHQNFGCGRNIIDSRRFMFEWCKFKKAIFIEDDLVVNPSYISFVLNLHDWAKKRYTNVGIVQGFNRCYLKREEKIDKLDQVCDFFLDFWGYCIDSDVYHKIKNTLYEYEQKFLFDIPRNEPNGALFSAWLNAQVLQIKNNPLDRKDNGFPTKINYMHYFKKSIPSYAKMWRFEGQDLVTRFALYKAGYIRIAPIVNRALYIGQKGVHDRYNDWNAWSNMNLDYFDKDIALTNFNA